MVSIPSKRELCEIGLISKVLGPAGSMSHKAHNSHFCALTRARHGTIAVMMIDNFDEGL